MLRLGTVQVVHSLTTGVDFALPDFTSWPRISSLLVGSGFKWPGAVSMATGDGLDPAVVREAVRQLGRDTELELGDAPVPLFWDTVAGLVGRAWRLGTLDAVDAVYRLDGMWWLIRTLDPLSSNGLRLIWDGMRLVEGGGFKDIESGGISLLSEADRLVPAGAVTSALCRTVLDGIY